MKRVRVFMSFFLFLNVNIIYSQYEYVNDLYEGETYTFGSIIFKVEKKNGTASQCQYKIYPHITGKAIDFNILTEGKYISNYSGGCFANRIVQKATGDQKDWLEACIKANTFIPKSEFDKSRGNINFSKISLNRTALDATYHGIQKEGWQFSNIPFRYQFVNCGGEVQMGVQYDRKADFITLVHNGSVYYEAHAPDLWPKSDQIEVGDVIAKLYFGNQYFGDVKLTYIVGNFAGCYGETFEVVKQVGKNPSQKDFLENLDKFSLKDIRIIRGDVTINYEKKQQIIKAVSYDAFGNPIKTDVKPTSSNSQGGSKPKYDAFGNPIEN